MPAPSPAALTCPRCGASLTASGCVCLRCIGEKALRAIGDTDGAPARPDSFDTSSVLTPTPGVGEPPMEQAPPRQLGAYTILEEIGRGGMGRVYAAQHTQLGTLVALKVIATGRFATLEQETRFIREAQTAARLKHAHIVTVHDAGRAEGVAYFTMDLVADGDLARRLHDRPLTPRGAAGLLAKVAAAVAHAHREGVLHRDLKPSNILLEGDEPRVADFGLAAQLTSGAELTAATRMLGTPAYLSPEVHAGGTRAASPASDVYALGAILYEMLTGRLPRLGPETISATFEPGAPRLLAPGVPRDLETICLKCIELKPAARYAGAAALADDLTRFLEGRPIHARPVAPLEHFARWCRRRPALAAVWFLVLALAIGSTAAAFLIARARAETRAQLWSARLAEGQAQILTRRAGRRAAALDALGAAARIQTTLEVRNAAIAALALTDLDLVKRWPITNSSAINSYFDASGHNYLIDQPDGFSWRETGTDRELALVPFESDTTSASPPIFSPDGRRALWRLDNGTVHLWEWSGREAVRRWRIENRPHPWPQPRLFYGGDLAFSPDGAHVTMAHPDGGVVVHAVDDGRELGRWRETWLPTRVRFSPDGKFLAVASAAPEAAKRIHLVESNNLTTVRTLDLGGDAADLAWSNSGRLLAACSNDPAVRVFNTADGTLAHTLANRDGFVRRLRFLGGDDALFTSTFELASRWRWVRNGEEFLRLENVEPAGFVVTTDGNEFFTTDAMTAGFHYRVARPAGVRVVALDSAGQGNSTAMTGSLGFSRDGAWLVATYTSAAIVFRTTDLSPLAKIITMEASEDVTVTFTADGSALITCGVLTGLGRRLITPLADGTLEIGPLETIDPAQDWFLRDISDDGQRLALTEPGGGHVKILATGLDGAATHAVAEWTAPGAFAAAFGADGTQVLVNPVSYVPGAAGELLHVWDIATGKPITTLDAPITGDADWNESASVAITANGTKRSVMWRTPGWKAGAELPAEAQGDSTAFGIAPDGRTVAIGTPKGVYLIDVATGHTHAMLNADVAAGYITAIKFSPNGRLLAALNADTQLFLWDLPALRAELAKLGLDW